MWCNLGEMWYTDWDRLLQEHEVYELVIKGTVVIFYGGLDMLNHEMSEELVNGLCGIFGDNIRQIILYGSVARNEATAESDIDIAIILNGSLSGDIRDAFLEFSANLDLKYERVFSIIDIDRSNMEKWGDVLPFYRNIREEGVVLWKAA